MSYEYILLDGTKYCNVYIDKTKTNGILRCSHEISVTFVFRDNKWNFGSAWHCGVEDVEWKADEEDSFEQTFPGLLDEMKEKLI